MIEMIEKDDNIQYMIICADVKNFKLINDIFGFEGGDSLLKKIADRLKDIAGSKGICGRISGDRFALCISSDKYDENDFHTNILSRKPDVRNTA